MGSRSVDVKTRSSQLCWWLLFEEQGCQALKPGFRLWCPAPALTARPFPAVSPAAGPLTSLLPVACPSPQGFTFGKAGEILTRRLRYLVFRSMLRQVGLPGMVPGGCALCPVGRRWDCCQGCRESPGCSAGDGLGDQCPRAPDGVSQAGSPQQLQAEEMEAIFRAPTSLSSPSFLLSPGDP